MMIEVNGELVPYNEKNAHPRRHDTRWLAPVIRIAFKSGMRRGEIFGLTWDRVYLTPTRIHPHGYISLYKKETKSGEERRVPLSLEAARVLMKQAKARDGEDPIFVGRTGRTDPEIRNGWNEVKRKAALDGLDFGQERLKGLHFHDLRASWAVDSPGRGTHFLRQNAGST